MGLFLLNHIIQEKSRLSPNKIIQDNLKENLGVVFLASKLEKQHKKLLFSKASLFEIQTIMISLEL